MEAESEEKQQQAVCYRDGDETGGYDTQEKRKIEDLKLAYKFAGLLTLLAGLPVGFPNKACLDWGLV